MTTAAQMNTELWQCIGAFADNESLMRRLTRYAKKLVKEQENAPTLMPQEEFYAKLERGEEDYRLGRTHSLHSTSELESFLNTL